MALSHINIASYYKIIFGMAQHHKYSIKEIEELYPFERDLYFEMLIEYLEQVKNEQQN